ncbi:hypothetical protein FT663_00401 [Candidozyma haemuli var. vulneris]|uniref:Transcription factor RBF1 n=1 Tax=Candidozyma haemuli TaxID=45357 RepID=A0A2V1AUY3_9ASCO|nr:hypothetical protein CXQ85_000631 [[Candida] haemuloni]KAF3988813.1 hypothetical protein FT662_03191 [[Candida] haemuloni var. vulneris]KAF3995510.1 hypothetical protein FT663_00401 [[Candida] haemuloni var. vulneris]PVH21648.1 hypothetical protein CXQ85_000631 [[Candida] haemuloni]
MSGPSTSNERSTGHGQGLNPHQQQHLQQQHLHHASQLDHTTAAAIALGHEIPNPVMAHSDEEARYLGLNPAAAAQLQQQQQQLQQQQLHHQHQLHHHHHPQLHQQQMHHPLQQQHHIPQHHLQQQQHIQQHQFQTAPMEFENGGFLVSRHAEGDIIKTFSSKQELVKYVKTVLNEEEQCKIVINSSKPKAVYFQCERSGSFRTTVKDATKRQRVAYTKRSKCGYRLVANLYPPDKDKAKKMKKETEFDGYPDDDKKESEMWILRMIHPAHNHPPEPNFASGGGGKKKRAKYTRTLVEKPLNRGNNGTAAAVAAVAGYPEASLHDHQLLQQQHYLQQQQQQQLHHQQLQHHAHHGQHHHDDGSHPSVQDVAVIAAMEAAPGNHSLSNPPVDPNIDSVDPNVDPSVQQHDHAHGHVH